MRRAFALLGLLNAAVWSAAPSWFTVMNDNTWTTVADGAGEHLADVVPSPLPPGAEGQSAIMNDWTGGAAIQSTGEYLIPCQGGHNGYYGNEIYALALRDENPGWKRIWGPTPNSQISTNDYGYNAAYTAYADGSPRPTHGWFTNHVSRDNRIWTTMAGACPSGIWTTECYSILRSNLTAGWTYHGRLWPTVPGGSPGSTFGYQSGPGAYDPVANKIWRSPDFATQDGAASIDVAAAVTAGEQSTSGPKVPGSTIYNVYLGGNPFGEAWSIVADDLSPRCWIVGAVNESGLRIMNIEANPGVFVNKSTAGSPAGWTGGVGAVYHKPSRAIYVGGSEYGNKIRKLSIGGNNPLTATYTWSEISPASGSVTPSHGGQYRGSYSKFQMIEDMGNGQSAICLVTDINGPTYVFKLPGTVSATEKARAAAGGFGLSLFPNPVKAGAPVRLAGEFGKWEVFDIAGRSVMKSAHRGVQRELTTVKMGPGLYIVKTRGGDKRVSAKLLVQN